MLSFEVVINHFYNRFQSVEASFSSKLVATINPNFPVWDEHVLRNLGLRAPVYGTKNRVEKTISLYDDIVRWYVDFLSTDDAKKLINLFDNRYKETNITDTKKIDFILWQSRG